MEILVYDWQQCIFSQAMDNTVLYLQWLQKSNWWLESKYYFYVSHVVDTVQEEGFSPHIINQANNACKEASGAECTCLPLNGTLLTNFPSAALTHPILKKQRNDFITAAQPDRDS